MKNPTRVFFVVDSQHDNEEIYETLEEAEAQYNTLKLFEKRHFLTAPRIYVALVKNAFREPVGNHEWNYDDYSDTFTKVAEIKT